MRRASTCGNYELGVHVVARQLATQPTQRRSARRGTHWHPSWTQNRVRTRQVPAPFPSLSLTLFLLLCSAVVWINKSRLDSRLIAACKSSANASAIKTTCFCAFQLVAQSQRRSQSLGWSQLCNRLPTIAVNWPKVSALRHVSIRRSTARSKWAAWVTQPDTRRLGADPLAAVQRLSMLISQ